MYLTKFVIAVCAAGALLMSGVASAVPVKTLPPVSQEIKDNNPAAGTRLQEWVNKVNQELSALEPHAPAAVVKMLFGDKSPITPLAGSDILQGLTTEYDPLIKRWARSKYEDDKNACTPADFKLINTLEKDYGLKLRNAEGEIFFEPDERFLLRRIAADGDLGAFLHVYVNQPAHLFSDAGCLYSVSQMGGYAATWEQYMKNNPKSELLGEAKKQYDVFMEYIMFSTLDNTPAFPRGKMTKQWQNELQKVIRQHQGTVTADVVAAFLKEIKANGGKLSAATQKGVWKRINDAFPTR